MTKEPRDRPEPIITNLAQREPVRWTQLAKTIGMIFYTIVWTGALVVFIDKFFVYWWQNPHLTQMEIVVTHWRYGLIFLAASIWFVLILDAVRN